MVNGFCIDDCSAAAKAALTEHLWRRSKLTWFDWLNADRKKLGTEKIDQSAIRVPIPAVVTKDATIRSWRAGDAGRVLGFREDATFHIVWVDPGLKVYKH